MTTVREQFERVTAARNMLLHGYFPHQIKQGLRKRFGMSKRAADSYLQKARAWIVYDTRMTKEDLRADAISVYKGIVQNPDAKDSDRIKAQERIDKLLGLEVPVIVKQQIEARVAHEHIHQVVVLEQVARENPDVRDAIIELSRKVQQCLTPSKN